MNILGHISEVCEYQREFRLLNMRDRQRPRIDSAHRELVDELKIMAALPIPLYSPHAFSQSGMEANRKHARPHDEFVDRATRQLENLFWRRAAKRLVKKAVEMKITIYRIFCFFALRLGLYYRWSRMYRALFERRWNRRVKPLSGILDLKSRTGHFKWRRDSWSMLRDVISYAMRLEETGVGDCDEFAVWALEAGRCGIPWNFGASELTPVGLLTLIWIKDGKRMGHNVGIFRFSSPFPITKSFDTRQCYFMFENGSAGVMSFALRDYGVFAPNLPDMLHDIVELRSGADAKPLAAALVTPDLKHVIDYCWMG